jgi:hypothetical protein
MIISKLCGQPLVRTEDRFLEIVDSDYAVQILHVDNTAQLTNDPLNWPVLQQEDETRLPCAQHCEPIDHMTYETLTKPATAIGGVNRHRNLGVVRHNRIVKEGFSHTRNAISADGAADQ